MLAVANLINNNQNICPYTDLLVNNEKTLALKNAYNQDLVLLRF